MRYSTVLTSIREALGSRQYSGFIQYRGNTQSTAVSELFLDGIPSRRLVPALDSSTFLVLEGVVHRTGVAPFITQRQFLVACSATGVITLTDVGESARAAAGPSGAVTPFASYVNATAAAATLGLQFTVVPLTATAPGYVRLDVSSTTAATTYWEVSARFVEAGPRG